MLLRKSVPQESSRCDPHPTGSVITSAAPGGERSGVHEEEQGWSAFQRSGTAAFPRGRLIKRLAGNGLTNGRIPRTPARLFLPVKTRNRWLEQERPVWSLVLVSGSRLDPAVRPGRVARCAQARMLNHEVLNHEVLLQTEDKNMSSSWPSRGPLWYPGPESGPVLRGGQ